MERSTEIWWLDLKGTASMQGTGGRYASMGRSASARNDATPFGRPDRNDTYAANSGSLHIRSSRREKPNAPGAISSLKFISGPHVVSFPSHRKVPRCQSCKIMSWRPPRSDFYIWYADNSLLASSVGRLPFSRMLIRIPPRFRHTVYLYTSE